MPRFDRLEFDPQPEEESQAPETAARGGARRGAVAATRPTTTAAAGCMRTRCGIIRAPWSWTRRSSPAGSARSRCSSCWASATEAELWARKSLELFRDQGDLMAGRAQALARIGDRTQAMEICDAAMKQEGQSAYRWMVRGELMVAGRDDVDRHCFDKAVQADPRLARAAGDRADLPGLRPAEQGAAPRPPGRREGAAGASTPGTCRAGASRSWASTGRRSEASGAAWSSRRGTSRRAGSSPSWTTRRWSLKRSAPPPARPTVSLQPG